MHQVKNTRIAGVSACVPAKKQGQFHQLDLDQSEIGRIRARIGVRDQRIAAPAQCASDLCHVAAGALLEELDWRRDEIGYLIFISQTPDYRLPGTAPLLQDRLGLNSAGTAIEINLGCSGYVYGLLVLAALMSTGDKRRGLLLVGDTPTKFISPRDRTTSLLFGDAGTATALEFCEGQEDWHFDMGSDGSRYEAIHIPDGGYRNPLSEDSLRVSRIEDGIERSRIHLVLDGIEVFNFSVWEPVKSIKNVLSRSSKAAQDIDYYVLHQANLMMNEEIRKKMVLPREKLPLSLEEYGNTSAASIPLTLVAKMRDVLRTKKNTLLLCGFGVGLSWGSVVLTTDRIACPEVVEIS